MKEEGAAYISAINVKDEFSEQVSPEDFLPDNLEASLDRIREQQERMESFLDKIIDETLRAELEAANKVIRGYRLVLRNIMDAKEQSPEKWLGLSYYLDPTVAVDRLPPAEARQAAEKLLGRILGFSDIARPMIQKNIAARKTQEAKDRAAAKGGKKAAPKKKAGFLNKLLRF